MRSYRFGISEFTTMPWSFERDIDRYSLHRLDVVEICQFKLNHDNYSPQLSRLRESNMTVSSVQSTVHSLFPDSLAPQPTAPEDRLRHMKDAIARISPHIEPHTPFIVITGAAPGGNTEMVYERCLRDFRDLGDFAAHHGVRLAYEPLNPILFNTDTALWGLDQALALVERINHPALGICVDTWNIFQTPNLLEVIRRCTDRMFVVQVSDWRRPRSGADRVSLGEGEIDTAAIVRAIRKTGYDGPYVLEIFSAESLPDSIWRSDLDAVLVQNREEFARIWEASKP